MTMSVKFATKVPDYSRQYAGESFRLELERVHYETAIEREWIQAAGLAPFETDLDLLLAEQTGELTRISRAAGYVAIDTLLLWKEDYSDPGHKYHYSPPLLRHDSKAILDDISMEWQEEMGDGRLLSVTSAGRSRRYQSGLRKKPGALTIMDDDMLSSHEVALAFDLDGCGLNEIDDEGNVRKMNPRYPGFRPELAYESGLLLKSILHSRQREGQLNFVEEFAGSGRHCFHVCPKPEEIS